MRLNLILKYFPDLTENQKNQFNKLQDLYVKWNAQINVISRKDIDELYTRHVLHSLGIAKVIQFKAGTSIMDVGTGGGFPGIPLAILFPESNFYLIDTIGKKIKVVNAVAEALALQNVEGVQKRAEKVKFEFDFIISRAVTSLPKFNNWIKGKFSNESFNDLPNGLLYLKGGDLTEEMEKAGKPYQSFELKNYFSEAFFDTKKVIYLESF
ncbi:MAG: 16S rRNA (guanine(527)-N(7))-methyltransferase RsmG [Flavobacteriales bacterium]|nr:16S rRNA (guanine(527)-N(7))-methyltransferase RsmG [Flavobacteriales bacterium]MBO72110.1 16S rRNA (guanine(527)-N(7))-methyltransferase RsmG [Flavobacteriales bacterium]|tara:strand:- start:3112 stop:3741 length:630 start_codon:yes stop_codon:yes gene_type:complete